MANKIPVAFLADPDMTGETVRILVLDSYSAPASNQNRTALPAQPLLTQPTEAGVSKVPHRVLYTTPLTNTGTSRLDAQA